MRDDPHRSGTQPDSWARIRGQERFAGELGACAMNEAASPKLRPGLEIVQERVVLREWTLAQFDPNLPAVFSTPAMIGLMEVTASDAIRTALAPDMITVGTRIEMDHLKAVPAGTSITVRAKLTEVNG